MRDNKEIKEDLGIKGSDTALIVLPPFYTNHSGNYELKACNSQGCTLRGLQIIFYGKKHTLNKPFSRSMRATAHSSLYSQKTSSVRRAIVRRAIVLSYVVN